jgi:hypothetical protein
VFDLVAPGGADFSYGLRLQDGTATLPNQDVIDFRVIDRGAGQMAVRLRDQDFVLGTVTNLETVNIDPTGYDTIMLRLARLDTGSNAVTASFQLLSSSGPDGAPTDLTATGSIFNHVDWTRAGFRSTAPIPEPETYAMLLAGLGLLGFMVRRRKNLA